MRIALRHQQQHLVIDVHPESGGYRISIDGNEHRVDVHHLDETSAIIEVDGRRVPVMLVHNAQCRLVAVAGETYTFVPETGVPSAHSVAMVASPEVTAPMPGKILQVLVQPGDRVAAGDGLLILEAMKMENRLVAETAGTVRDVRVTVGDMVNGGQILVVVTYDEPSLEQRE